MWMDGLWWQVLSRLTENARAHHHQCLFATNGGYFHMKSNECLGNVVSDGQVINRSNRQNAHFGITSDGLFVVGYLPGANEQHSTLR